MRTVGCGDEFDSGTVNAYQLADFADSCQLDRRLVARTLHRLARDVLAQIDGVVTLAQTDAEVRYLERFISLVVVRCKYLLAEAPGIAEIEV